MENVIENITEIDRKNPTWKFENELLTLLQKVQGAVGTRPIIITIQEGNTRWVLNTDNLKVY